MGIAAAGAASLLPSPLDCRGRRAMRSAPSTSAFRRGPRRPAPSRRRDPLAGQGDGHGHHAGRAARDDPEARAPIGRPTTTGARCEAQLNALPQFVTEIDGLDIHFIHVRSKHDNALPIIVTHGWPGSIIEQLKIIEPLTDPDRPWRQRGGRLPRRDPVAAGLRLLRQADGAGLDPRPHRQGLGDADAAPRLHANTSRRAATGAMPSPS